MNKNLPLILSTSCILTGSILVFSTSAETQITEPKKQQKPSSRSSHLGITLGSSTTIQVLPRAGFLWENSLDPQVAQKTQLTLPSNTFNRVLKKQKGQKVVLLLSDTFPAVKGTTTNSGMQDDGTQIMHVTLDTDPAGTLVIQENVQLNFFNAHITFKDHPLAYRFTKKENHIHASRLSIEGILCSQADQSSQAVEAGLPPYKKRKAEARGGNSSNKNKKTPQLSITNASASEGEGHTINFQVNLSKESSSSVTVDYQTQNVSANNGSDYVQKSGTLTFPPSERSKIITINLLDDLESESPETFQVLLSSADGATIQDAIGVGTINDNDALPPSNSPPVPILNSRLAATAIAYLDMDGQTVTNTAWNSGSNSTGITVTGINDAFPEVQMTAIWTRVAEDFAPFDINITTDEQLYLSAPSNLRIRCIITPDYQWYGSAGGVAYLNSFNWTGDTPCWVFSSLLANSPKYIADATAHEIGHTLKLLHDGRRRPNESYYQGHGDGDTGWAPIMGVSYYVNLGHWSKGEYTKANNKEDDLALIASNGFDYRSDDHADDLANATILGTEPALGLIETNTDTDTFRFTATSSGEHTFTSAGFTVNNNLDIQLELLDSSGTSLKTDNPFDSIDAQISHQLDANASYHLRVSGTGKAAINGDQGYTDYGSLGEYQLSVETP